VRQAQPFVATFTCNLPNHAPWPARMSLYGHGLLGDQGEVNGSLVRTMSATYNVAYCATDLIGMAEEDIGNAITSSRTSRASRRSPTASSRASSTSSSSAA
jgi:hypothetical protein